MENKDLRIANVFLGIIVVLAMGVVIQQLQTVLLPVVLAVFLSYIFKPVVLFLKQRRMPLALALLVVFVVVSGLFFGLSVIIYSSFESFVQEAPKYQDKLGFLLRESMLTLDSLATQFNVKPEHVSLADLVDVSSLTSLITAGAGSFVSGIGSFVLILLLMFFILAGSGDLVAKIRYAFSERHSDQLAAMIESVDLKVRQYLIAKTLISFVTGAITTLILLIFGVDFALLWGFLAFLLNFIPNIGSIVAVIFPILIALLQFDSASTAIILLILLITTQMIMGNVIEPKLMSFSLDLSPLLVLVALIFWGWLWGIWGMILAVPIMSILKIVFENVEALKPIGAVMSGKIPGRK